jgi:hypothetical protein
MRRVNRLPGAPQSRAIDGKRQPHGGEYVNNRLIGGRRRIECVRACLHHMQQSTVGAIQPKD